MNPLNPTPALLSKLGSIAIHAEELSSPQAHSFDRAALASVLSDPEVREWLDGMDALAMIPKKRTVADALLSGRGKKKKLSS